MLDLIKEKPLSRRFTYLDELALKVVVLRSKLEADTDEPEKQRRLVRVRKQQAELAFMFECLFENGHRLTYMIGNRSHKFSVNLKLGDIGKPS